MTQTVEVLLSRSIENEDESIHQGYRLYQNALNPFRESTTVMWYMAEAVKVRVEILDNAGRMVDLIDEGAAKAGLNTVDWSPQGSVSGTYHAILTLENGIVLRNKLVLID